MPNSLTDMLDTLVRQAVDDEKRHENAWHSFARANEVGRRLPLVHRTCKSDTDAKWLDILRTRSFVADKPCTGARELAAGIPRATYFFLGVGAYPKGLVAFVLDSSSVLKRSASYTPFDSGSVDNPAFLRPMDMTNTTTWDDAAKDRFLAAYVGTGSDVLSFAGPYLAAHFVDPLSYVRAPQISSPDFAPYHGMSSPNDDRRAWTIEVQVHDDVTFGTGAATLNEIVVARKMLLEDLPDDLVDVARVATPENDVLGSVSEGIVSSITAEIP
jgi:hypothetical protein